MSIVLPPDSDMAKLKLAIQTAFTNLAKEISDINAAIKKLQVPPADPPPKETP